MYIEYVFRNGKMFKVPSDAALRQLKVLKMEPTQVYEPYAVGDRVIHTESEEPGVVIKVNPYNAVFPHCIKVFYTYDVSFDYGRTQFQVEHNLLDLDNKFYDDLDDYVYGNL